MDLAKQTKDYFYELVKKLYDNDSRITKELLFSNNELNKNGICFKKHISQDSLTNTYGISMIEFKIPFDIKYNDDRNTRDKIRATLDNTRFSKGSNDRWFYVRDSIENLEKEYIKKFIIPLAKERVETFIKDTNGYYFFTDSYDGVWLTVISQNNVAFDLMENEQEKKALLDLDSIPNSMGWEQALEQLN